MVISFYGKNNKKIELVKSIFISTGAAEETQQAIKKFTSRAFDILELINISESSKLGLILYLFKYKNLNSLKRNYNFKLLQKIGILSIKKLKLKIEKEEWKDKKKRIEALNIELKLLKGIDKFQETSIAV